MKMFSTITSLSIVNWSNIKNAKSANYTWYSIITGLTRNLSHKKLDPLYTDIKSVIRNHNVRYLPKESNQ